MVSLVVVSLVVFDESEVEVSLDVSLVVIVPVVDDDVSLVVDDVSPVDVEAVFV